MSRKRIYTYWTLQEEKELREVFNSMTLQDLSYYFDRSVESVQGKLQKLRLLKNKKYTLEDDNNIENLIFKGYDKKNICKKLNISSISLTNRLLKIYKTSDLKKIRKGGINV